MKLKMWTDSSPVSEEKESFALPEGGQPLSEDGHMPGQCQFGRCCPEKTDLTAYLGCYKLALSPWVPARPGRPYVNPPAAIELTGLPTKQSDEGLVVKPALGAAGIRFGISYWNATPDGTITVWWSDNFNGIRMTVKGRGLELVGLVESFSDLEELDVPPPKAEILAEKVSCVAAK